MAHGSVCVTHRPRDSAITTLTGKAPAQATTGPSMEDLNALEKRLAPHGTKSASVRSTGKRPETDATSSGNCRRFTIEPAAGLAHAVD